MRNRSRTQKEDLSGSWGRIKNYRTICSNPNTVTSSQVGGGTFSISSSKQTSTMSDQLSPVSAREKKVAWRKRQNSLREVDPKFRLQHFMPNHPCVHTTSTIRFQPGPIATLHSSQQCTGVVQTWGSSYDNAAVLLRQHFGYTDPAASIRSTQVTGTAGAFRKHDWYALTSRFNEACDSFLPSSMMLGETMYEHSIFVDALKYVVNPTRAVKDFLGGVVALGLKKKNLGTIARVIKGSSNAWLSYNFGVKPAIEDVIHTLEAHVHVQRRLWYLANNGGSYVPIRVKDESSSETTIPALPALPRAGSTTFQRRLVSKVSTARISAWGKVREDLNWKDSWTAYLQYFGVNKVIGLAWELIPFSFVLDWFTNAQERINELTRFRIGEPFTEIRNLTCSTTEETFRDIILIPGNDNSIGATMYQPSYHMLLAREREKTYSRYLTIPETSGVVDFSNLGLFQLIASGALIVQRVLR